MYLLNLPAELRLQIYSYALTDTSSPGLQYQEIDFSTDNPRSIVITLNGKPFNKLQHVCRQLRTETADLELALNALFFEQADDTDLSPTELLHRFYDRTSTAEFAQISTLILKPSKECDNQPFEDLVALAGWCRLHPKVSVKYILSHFSFQDLTFPGLESLPDNRNDWMRSAGDQAREFMHSGLVAEWRFEPRQITRSGPEVR